MQELTDSTFSAAAKNAIIEFWAPWCGPCRIYGPILERVSAKHPKVTFAKINVDENQETASEFGIMSIPTTIFFKDGKPVDMQVGVLNEEKLTQMIKKIWGASG
jgi:thioredoxin 1